MRVEELNNEAIIVELSSDDMKSLNITYEEMDYANVETKRVIWTVLSRVKRTLGREFDTTGRLFVEAMRQGTDGCVLFFTREAQPPHPKHCLLRQKPTFLTAQFSSLDTVFACAQALAFAGLQTDSRLYMLENKYRLLVKQTANGNTLRQYLHEFGTLIGDSEAITLHTDEHWHCLIRENALEKLTRKASS